MYLFQAAKLAWANTTNDWQRLLVRCSGITFAVVLMFMQTGFRNALFDSNVRIAERTDADFVIRSSTRYMLSSGQLMPFENVIAARNVHGVREVQPLYFETVASFLRKTGQPTRRLRVIAFDLRNPMFDEIGLREFAELLDAPLTAVADVKSKPMFEFDSDNCQNDGVPYGELSGKVIHIVGCFSLGIDFSNSGNIVMTPANFEQYFPLRGRGNPLQAVDYGLVRCEPDADKHQVFSELKSRLGPNVIVNTKEGFLKSEREFWGNATPVGLIFMFGTLIGFVVGLIICYQVLATDIGDHMNEFATIKAMGYPTGFFGAVVVIQALFLSLAAFVPGIVIALSVFAYVNSSSGMLMFLNLERTTLVLFLTMGMCVISGIIALRKLLSTDPANLF